MTPLETFRQRYTLVPDSAGPIVTTTAGRDELCALFAALGFTKGAEVGVWTGLFSKRLCQTIPGLHLTCVDPWRAYDDYHDRKNDQARLERAYLEARERLATFNCRVLRMDSIEAASYISDRSLDFVYIDGNHGAAFVQGDLEAWSPKVRQGGIIAGHDYGSDSDDIQVQAVVDTFTLERGIEPVFVLGRDKSSSFFWTVS